MRLLTAMLLCLLCLAPGQAQDDVDTALRDYEAAKARAALAGSLLVSLDTEVDEDAEAAWATELNRRVAELDSGAVKTIPWAEIRRRLAVR